MTLQDQVLLSDFSKFCLHERFAFKAAGFGEEGEASGTGMGFSTSLEEDFKKLRENEKERIIRSSRDRCQKVEIINSAGIKKFIPRSAHLTGKWHQRLVHPLLDVSVEHGLLVDMNIVKIGVPGYRKRFILTPQGKSAFSEINDVCEFLEITSGTTQIEAQQIWAKKREKLEWRNIKHLFEKNPFVEVLDKFSDQKVNLRVRTNFDGKEECDLAFIWSGDQAFPNSLLDATEDDTKILLKRSLTVNRGKNLCFVFQDNTSCELWLMRILAELYELGFRKELIDMRIWFTTPSRLENTSQPPWMVYKITSLVNQIDRIIKKKFIQNWLKRFSKL